jgi:phosphoribosylanthranilate isomerase
MKTRIKICGLTNLEDARFAAQQGVDLLGFIFYPPSPRYVSPEAVAAIVSTLQAEQADPPKCVGVFVNESLEQVESTMQACQLGWAQLHGDESAAFVAHFQGRAFKAFNPPTLADAQAGAAAYAPQPDMLLLLDAYHPQLRGGTGHTADWPMAARIAAAHTLLLAGGLNPDNVATAIEQVRPWGVDVSSGVEASKGRKDHAKVQAFIAAVRTVDGRW